MLISTVCTLCTHVSYVWSVISAELKVQNGWTNLMASAPYTIGNIAAGLSAILAGITSDRKNPGRMALFGAIMVGAGLCILAVFSKNFFLVCLGYGILVECGQNFSNVGLPNAALKWKHGRDLYDRNQPVRPADIGPVQDLYETGGIQIRRDPAGSDAVIDRRFCGCPFSLRSG